MSLVLVTPPAIEPVSLADAKAHLRVDVDDEDVLIQSLILTSRLQIEAALSIALVTQSWMMKLDGWPREGIVALPMAPLRSVTEIRVHAADGTPMIVSPDHYEVDASSNPPRIARHATAALVPGRRVAGIAVDFTAGFGDSADDVPAPIRQALLMLVAHWYENREPPTPRMVPPVVPDQISDLLRSYRTVRL